MNFNIKPISLNKCETSLRNGVRVKSKWYNEFAREFKTQMKQYENDLNDFALVYKRDRHAIEMDFDYFFPRNKLLTKQNYMSKKSMDLDNLMKPMIDLLFKRLEKTNNDINDSHVTRIMACKHAQDDKYQVLITMKIIDHKFGAVA